MYSITLTNESQDRDGTETMMDDERRRYRRVPVYHPIRLHVPGTHQVVETLTKNLSIGGVCCLGAQAFPTSTALNIELMLFRGGETISAQGVLSWFRDVPYGEQFDLGIMFSDLPQLTERHLSAYLDHISRSPVAVPA